MAILPYQTETEIARTELHDALKVYSRAPTVPNEKRVSAAMKRWREIIMLQDLSQASPELSDCTQPSIHSASHRNR